MILIIPLLGFAQQENVEIIKFDQFEALMNSSSDDLKIFNFWATWCGPCVKEIPHFEEANNNFENAEIYLISLDFASNILRVEQFIKKKDLKNKVYLLDEIDYNSWIDKVSKEWSGAIPASLFIDRNGKKTFIEGEMTKEELFNTIEKHSK